MHLYSLCQTWLNLKTHTVSETENRTSCLTTVSQTITVSSCLGERGGGGLRDIPKCTTQNDPCNALIIVYHGEQNFFEKFPFRPLWQPLFHTFL